MHIVNFKDWYFQKPPKQNFFELPSLLWLVACDNAYLAPAPVISRIQMLCGDPKPDGIWGSGTTELVQTFFHNKTAPVIVKFAQELTDLMVKRYEELGGYDAYADSAPHWIERCKRKLQMLYDYVTKQNELADAGEELHPQEAVTVIVDGVPMTKNVKDLNAPPVETVNTVDEQPAPEAPNDDLLGLAAIIDNQANVIAAQTKAIDKQIDLGENIAQRVDGQSEAVAQQGRDVDALGLCVAAQSDVIKEQSQNINKLFSIIDAQGNVIREMKDALLSHTTAQEQILKKLSEDIGTDEPDEQPPAKQPAGRDLLNEVPDSLVRS